ncbi:MAG: AAA family ATPase [Sedimentisphaerales bacterium]|nr:AAA family ATPase [Sedimentisphaerales bacterium]
MVTTKHDEISYLSLIGKMRGPLTEKEILTGVDSIIDGNSDSDIYISRSFARRVLLHLSKNYHIDFSSAAELILAITGPFGVGKSVMVMETCRRLGIKVHRVSVTELSSEWEGQPAKAVAQKYYQASKTQIEEKIPCCLVIDDVDLAIGNFSEFSSGTKNTQHLINVIMEIADNPTLVCGHKTARVPIIMTANDLSKVYGAITRPRRMRAWTYQPSSKEVFDIGCRIIGDILTNEQLSSLQILSVNWKPAHFSQLKSIFQEMMLESQCSSVNAKEYVHAAFQKNPAVRLVGLEMTEDILFVAIDEVERGRIATKKSYV